VKLIPIGLKASLSASMVALALLVSIVAAAIQTGLVVTSTVSQAVSRAEAVGQQAALLARAAAAGRPDPAVGVRRDRALRALFESALAGDPTLFDIGVFDARGRALIHSLPERAGQTQPPRLPLDDLDRGNVFTQAANLLGAARLHQAVVPLESGGRPFGEVRVGVSTALLRYQLLESLRAGAWVMGIALLLAILAALGFAHLLALRVRTVVSGLERLREGEFGHRLAVEGRDELALLASSINALGEHLEAARARAAAGEAGDEELLVATGRLSAWAKTASGLAHEMADPLNAAALHLGHLKRKWRNPEPAAARHLGTLENELKRLERIVLGFRRFSMLGEMRPEWFDLRALLAEVAERAREGMHGGRTRLHCEPGDAPRRFWGDPSLLRQALANLIANADQSMPGGGQVSLTTRVAGAGVEIRVADEGIGIPEELQPRVFDLYFTTKDGGSGTGLSVVQQVVQLHGGRVRMRSVAGEGTEITLELPVRSPSTPNVPPAEEREAVHAA
jgi:signal transduction histidine kinase